MTTGLAAISDDYKKIYALNASRGREERASQVAMTRLCLENMANRGHSIAEGPTGVGKSFAYLVAACLRSLEKNRVDEGMTFGSAEEAEEYHGGSVLISTATKGLQEQLVNEFNVVADLVEEVVGKRPVMAVVKGRQNYVSKVRFYEFLTYRMDDAEREGEEETARTREELDRVKNWVETTATGDLAEIFPLPDFMPMSLICAPDKGSIDDDCFYKRAIERAKGADVIITNHSSVLARLRSATTEDHTRLVVFEDLNVRDVIFDEAHEVEETAIELFSEKMSMFEIKNTIAELLTFSERENIGTHMKHGGKKYVDILRDHVSSLWDVIREFQDMRRDDGQVVRIKNGERNPIHDRVNHAIRQSNRAIETAQTYCEKLMAAASKKSVRADIVSLAHQNLSAAKAMIAGIKSRQGTKGSETVIYSSDKRSYPSIMVPSKDTSLRLRNAWSKFDSVFFTSATLCLPKKNRLNEDKERHGFDDGWAYFCYGMGLPSSQMYKPAKYEYKRYPSPFDYEKNVQLVVPVRDAPEPDPQTPQKHRFYLDYVAEMIRNACANDSQGGIMCLFTSYRDIAAVEKRLIEHPERLHGRKIMAQRTGWPMKDIKASFTSTPRENVLLALGSFWTGVDLPGNLLTTLLIAKLPFMVKESPSSVVRELNLTGSDEERKSKIYPLVVLPAAIMRFRQGIGRLLRTKTDSGRLYVADTKIYGSKGSSQFLTVLNELVGTRTEFQA